MIFIYKQFSSLVKEPRDEDKAPGLKSTFWQIKIHAHVFKVK